MSSKLKGWIIAGVILLILSLPIIFDVIGRNRIQVISYDAFVDLVSDMQQDEFAIVYFGDTEAANFEDIRESLRTLRDEFENNDQNIQIIINAVNVEELTETERNSLQDLFESDVAFVFVRDRNIVHVEEGSTTIARLKVLVNQYLNFEIPEDEVAYIVPETAEEYLEALRGRNNIVMTVFGNDECPWCLRFAPNFNNIAREFDVDIFYVNSTRMDRTEFTEILESGLMIPAQCTQSSEEDVPLSSGFGTPLTLFTRNGVVFDCLSGYVPMERLFSKMQEVGILESN